MNNFKIDINVDLGEGLNNEPQLIPFISSCNIACGGHAGSYETMKNVVNMAKQYDVKIGAHPSFPDIENFGRLPMEISDEKLYESIKSQLHDLLKVINEEHAIIHHIKPHGALYNRAAVDKKIAAIIIEVVKSISLPIKLYVPYKSVIADLAKKNNIETFYEAFADRNYNDDLSLVSRNKQNALINDKNAIVTHVLKMIISQKVTTISGKEIPIKADTFCIHGDNPKAVSLVKYLKNTIEEKGINIR